MCGIIGIISDRQVADPIFDGLKRLEYRGYDSAGIATLAGGQLQRRRAEGKLDALAQELKASASVGMCWHRSHKMGHPRLGDRGQRASAPIGKSCVGA